MQRPSRLSSSADLLTSRLTWRRIEAQAIGRVHRLGQRRRTRVLRLLVDDTIEQNVMQLQEQKMIQSGGGHAGQASELLMSDLLELVKPRTSPPDGS